MTTYEHSGAELPDDTSLLEGSFPDEIQAEDWGVAPPPKRRLHWTTVVLSFAAIAVLAFAGGIVAQKHWGKASSAGFAFPGGGGLPSGLAGNPGSPAGGLGGFPAASGFGAAGTTGTVSYIQGTTLYVTTAAGSVVKVRVAKGVPVSRTVESKVSGIRPGERIVIQGSTTGNGIVKATSVTVSPK